MLNYHHVAKLLQADPTLFDQKVRSLDFGAQHFDFNQRPALMGVINLSTDSVYAESICTSPTEAILRGEQLQRQGADFVDIGAESTLPDARKVGCDEQIAKLVPVVTALAARGVLVSVESYLPQVLEACALAGCAVFNLTGNLAEEAVFQLASHFEVGVVHCYLQTKNTVRDVEAFSFYADMSEAMLDFFATKLTKAKAAGLTRNIIDPGLGFYYQNLQDGRLRSHHQLETFLHTAKLHRLGWPVLNILPHAPQAFGVKRQHAEAFFAVLAMLGRTHLIRTHEVEHASQVRAALALHRA